MQALIRSRTAWRHALTCSARATRPRSFYVDRICSRNFSSRPFTAQLRNHTQKRWYSSSNTGQSTGRRWNQKITSVLLGKHRRKWTVDDIIAMFSWLFVGNTLFVLIGTTTFGMIVLGAANSLQFQELVASLVGRSISSSLGDAEVIFESAIVPNWKSRRIRLKQVRISSKEPPKPQQNRSTYDNITRYDVKVASIEVTLSLMRWLEGKGIIKDAIINGVRGEVDRTNVDPWGEIPPRSTPTMGDVNLESLIVDDSMLTLHFPDFHPYNISIFHGEYPRLRKQWFLYDFLLGDSVSGMYDHCLFSVYKRQESGYDDGKPSSRKLTFEVHNVPVNHVNAGAVGPFGWITKGNLDVVAHFEVPDDGESKPGPVKRLVDTVKNEINGPLNAALDDIVQLGSQGMVISAQRLRDRVADESSLESALEEAEKVILSHVDVRLNNIKASVPLTNQVLSYVSGALIQPVVAYVNANPAAIPIKFSIAIPVSEFYGAFSAYQVGIPSLLSEEAGKAIVELYRDDRRRHRELKRIGLWSLQTLTKNILNLVDYSRRSALSWASDVLTSQEALQSATVAAA